jgi:hypothetical protein
MENIWQTKHSNYSLKNKKIYINFLNVEYRFMVKVKLNGFNLQTLSFKTI